MPDRMGDSGGSSDGGAQAMTPDPRPALLQKRAELQALLTRERQPLERHADPFDRVTDALLESQDMTLDRLIPQLRQVEAALRRQDDGTRRCSECGREIPAKRIAA